MRMALPKGRLFTRLEGALEQSGIWFTFENDRDYHPRCSESSIVAVMRKPRAIPQLVALGMYDVGFCGYDLVREASYDDAAVTLFLGLNKVRLVVAVHESQRDILNHPPKRPLVIASEYTNLAHEWATQRGLAHIVIQTWGSTESYVPDDADIVFDCVDTGATLEANRLVVIDEILQSETCLITHRDLHPTQQAEVERLTARLVETIARWSKP